MKKSKTELRNKVLPLIGTFWVFEYPYIIMLLIKASTANPQAYHGIIMAFRNGFFIEMFLFFVLNIIFELVFKEFKFQPKKFKIAAWIFAIVVFAIGIPIIIDLELNTNFWLWAFRNIVWILAILVLPHWIVVGRKKKKV